MGSRIHNPIARTSKENAVPDMKTITEQDKQSLRREVLDKFREAAAHTAAAVEFDRYVRRVTGDKE